MNYDPWDIPIACVEDAKGLDAGLRQTPPLLMQVQIMGFSANSKDGNSLDVLSRRNLVSDLIDGVVSHRAIRFGLLGRGATFISTTHNRSSARSGRSGSSAPA